MAQEFTWGNDLMAITFRWDDDSAVCMSAISVRGLDVAVAANMPLAELMVSGSGHWIASGRLVHTTIGRGLRYTGHEAVRDPERRIARLTVEQMCKDPALRVVTTYELPDGVAMFRTYTTVQNLDAAPVVLESVTSWATDLGAPEGAAPDVAAWSLTEAEYDWLGEGRWHTTPLRSYLPVLGQQLTGHDPRGAHIVTSTGSWSTGRHAPLAMLQSERFGMTWLFQVEHSGAWRWEVGDNTTDAYVALSGPTAVDHSWMHTLVQGESFSTVPASVTVGVSPSAVTANITAYRRAMRVHHTANRRPQVVFNDYMNTINGDPTTEKLLPLIKGAAEVGCEIFVIDCGWYDDDGDWWPSVGEWMPSKTRFPGNGGMREVVDAIRDADMVPGLWLEPEVVGVESPVARRLPDSAFFQRNGRRVVEQERYILDFRDPAARAHMDEVVDRLVDEYGIGYFKMDYNVSPGAGTDFRAFSVGDGMLEHVRAYGEWIEALYHRHPGLILENCSSGGMREDFAQTSRFQVQSTSDQQDYRLYPPIAASAQMMMLPEQAASWAYPQSSMTPEQTAFNINTTMLGRFFLSGYINRMDERQLAIVRDGIAAYKRYVQPVVGEATPFWPMSLPGWDDAVLSFGLETDDVALITVWSRESVPGTVAALRVPRYRNRDVVVSPIFPVGRGFSSWPTEWDASEGVCRVRIPEGGYVSRTFLVKPKGGECHTIMRT